jgi:hypothetical protein
VPASPPSGEEQEVINPKLRIEAVNRAVRYLTFIVFSLVDNDFDDLFRNLCYR